MNLNLPIYDQLAACKNLLIAGMGGGFDVFAGLPVYFELRRREQAVHLANYTFSDTSRLTNGIRLTETLVGVTADHDRLEVYFPESFLAKWFRQKRGEEVTIWCFEKTGVIPLLESYHALVERLSIDGILLIDGGVDSLMRGDEAEPGTLIEDSISLCAVNELRQVPVRLMGCIGLGAEEHLTYAQAFENIAALAEAEALLGTCSLLRQMESYRLYEDAVLYVQSRPHHAPSIISSSVISAVQGHFGDFHLTDATRRSRLWISPLMPIYWFFDLEAVAGRNFLLSQLLTTTSLREAMFVTHQLRQLLPRRPPNRVPWA